MKKYITIAALTAASILILAAAPQQTERMLIQATPDKAEDFHPGDARMVVPADKGCLFNVETSTDLKGWIAVTNGTIFPPSKTPRYFRMRTFTSDGNVRVIRF